MSRWFVVLLLVFLPLQFSWAAVAPYCGHEADAQTQHLGHHEHQHTAPTYTDKNSALDQGALAGVDLDCSHCHGTAGMPAPGDVMAPLSPASRPVSAAQGILRTRMQTPPERPQWAPLA